MKLNGLLASLVLMSIFGVNELGAATIASRLQLGANVEVSARVVRLRDGKVLVERNPALPLIPASVMKLVTSAAVLDRFGPTHTFVTSVRYSGERRGDSILGDLHIKGDGDPLLISEKLWQLAVDVAHLGVTNIKGDLVVDQSLFGDAARDSARLEGEERSTHAYDAPVTALAVNFNTLAVAISAGDAVGEAARVSLDPYPIAGVELQNSAQGVLGEKSDVRVLRSGATGEMARLTVSGTVGMNAPIVKIYRSSNNPELFSGELIRAFLAAAGVNISGKIRLGMAPPSANSLIDVTGYPLARIVEGLNKFSTNFTADMLTKRLGARFGGAAVADSPASGTMRSGAAVLTAFLKSDVRTAGTYVIEDGSGLSPGNRLSAAQLVQLLTWVERRMDLFPEFLLSLPSMGADGTLKRRMAGEAYAQWHGQVRAKTGTLTSPVTVSSLAGFLRHPTHGLVAFALIANGKAGRPQPGLDDMHRQQDELIAALMTSR